MPSDTFDTTPQGLTDEQKAQEAALLQQAEKLEQLKQQEADIQNQQRQLGNEDPDLIGGKFKSQDDLLKAYQELEQKLSRGEQEDEDEVETEESEPEEEAADDAVMRRAADEYVKDGQLSEAAIDELSKMDSKDLIKAYVDFYQKNAESYQQQVQLQAGEEQAIMDSVGGKEAYGDMLGWAAQNLEQAEIDSFNSVTNSGNLPAIRFAVEALANRYQSAVGYEAEMVTGKASVPGLKPYRSNAELARDLADPRYATDTAFQADVEARVANSPDLFN
jgi:hypothetical protein